MGKENTTLTVGMIYDVFELANGDTCAFNVYTKSGQKCIWRITPNTIGKLPEMTEDQRNLPVGRITATASAIFVDITTSDYKGPYIHGDGSYLPY